jgi:hypothetical protein
MVVHFNLWDRRFDAVGKFKISFTGYFNNSAFPQTCGAAGPLVNCICTIAIAANIQDCVNCSIEATCNPSVMVIDSEEDLVGRAYLFLQSIFSFPSESLLWIIHTESYIFISSF